MYFIFMIINHQSNKNINDNNYYYNHSCFSNYYYYDKMPSMYDKFGTLS